MILNKFVVSNIEEKLINIMDKVETNTPVAGETPAVTVTVQGEETPTVQNPGEVSQSDSANDKPTEEQVTDLEAIELDAKDPKKTFETLRRIADEATKAAKQREAELKAAQDAIRDKEVKEAESKGEFEALYRKTLEDSITLKAQKEAAETKVKEFEKDKLKDIKPLNDALNRMIDLQMESWDDEDKSVVDSADKALASERLKQYEKIAPLINKARKANKPVNHGATPTPKDVRETSNEKPGDEDALYAKLQSMLHYG
jgi:hypothetical protein